MIDTNQINQAVDAARDIHAQVQTNWPAIVLGTALVSREAHRFTELVATVYWKFVNDGGLKNIWLDFWRGKERG